MSQNILFLFFFSQSLKNVKTILGSSNCIKTSSALAAFGQAPYFRGTNFNYWRKKMPLIL